MDKAKSIEEIRLIPDIIGEAGIEKDLRVNPEVLSDLLGDKDLRVEEPFFIHYEVNRRQDAFHARINIKGKVHTNCSRCLSPMGYPVDLFLQSDYVPAPPEMVGELDAHHLCVQRWMQGPVPAVRHQPERGPLCMHKERGPQDAGTCTIQEQTLRKDRSQQCHYQREDTRAPGETNAGRTIP
jgi:hypothetical protein